MTKLAGRDLYNKLSQPKKILAPMVDQSELAWRIVCRNHGADLCYTPMFHAKLFATDEKYRKNNWSPFDGLDVDRPLVVQFCANDADYLLQAAKLVESQCDAVDLNLGCPQGIARKGHYGSFLMEDWPLVEKLIRNLHENLSIPVTAKIRIYDDWQKSLDYAKMVLSAGAQFLTVHGRTRDMKGQKTGLANWDVLRYLRENLPKDTVFFSNGNIIYNEDIERCIEKTTCDGIMSAEGQLYNPGIFNTDNEFPMVNEVLREYFEVVSEYPTPANRHAMKAHFFKILHEFLNHHKELRPVIGKTSVHDDLSKWEEIVATVEKLVQEEFSEESDKIDVGKVESWGGKYREVPYWRCQPYFRRVDGEKQNTRVLEVAATKPVQEVAEKAEGSAEESARKRVKV